jgi:hypothetical protein
MTFIKKQNRKKQNKSRKYLRNHKLVLGRMIVDRQENAGRGKSVVERLSADLRQDFPGVSGFSVQNLWYMRQFYQEYRPLTQVSYVAPCQVAESLYMPLTWAQ